MKAKIFFENEAEKRLYVEACDRDFEERLDAVMKEVCREDMKYLTLSGPTCSGNREQEVDIRIFREGKKGRDNIAGRFFPGCQGSCLRGGNGENKA